VGEEAREQFSLQISPVCPPITVMPHFAHTHLLLCDSSNHAALYDILCFQVLEVGDFISVPALGWSRSTDVLMTRI
jgi:hypothetical protein